MKKSPVRKQTVAKPGEKTSAKPENNALRDLFLAELADIYDAENRLAKALPKMAKAAESEDLVEAFQGHLEETREHVEKVGQIFAAFDKPAKGKKCEAIVGLLEEADEIAKEHKGTAANDAALISAAQKIEHYEIASYGCLKEWAAGLGNDEAAELLEEILSQEKAADEKLTGIARAVCNAEAMAGMAG